MLQGLVSAARDRKIKLRVVSDVKNGPYNDTVDLINAGLYHVMLCPLSLHVDDVVLHLTCL